MKKKNNLGHVFRFSFGQRVKSRKWQTATILIAVILFALPAVLLPLADVLMTPEETAEAVYPGKVYVAAAETEEAPDLTLFLGGLKTAPEYAKWLDTEFIAAEGSGAALKAAEADPASLVVILEDTEEGAGASVILPEGSVLPMESADLLASCVRSLSPLLVIGQSGVSLTDLAQAAGSAVSGSVYMSDDSGNIVDADNVSLSEEEEIENGADTFREAAAAVLPYLNIMLLYFLVLFYGQTTAQSVMLEKTSKLMDTMLLSVKPEQMVAGKVLAGVLACLIQVSCWLAGLILGLFAGMGLIRTANPESDLFLLKVFEKGGLFTEIFTPATILFFLLYVAAGMLLYLSLSSIGGAISGKQEDLNSANLIFVMVLVVSFFATLYSLGQSPEGAAGATVLDFIPFTSILVTPGHIMAGTVTPLQGCISLGIVVVTAFLIMYLAGRIYKMYALYKGSVPKPGEIVKALSGK